MFHRGEFNTEIERPDASLLEELKGYDVALLHEAHKQMGGWSLLAPEFRCTPDDATCVGVAVTALMPEGDNLGMFHLLEVAQPGDVMVMTSVHGTGRLGTFGDLAAETAKARGVAGVVTNGTIRDTEAIRKIGLPIWHRGVNALGMIQQKVVGLNIPVAVGAVIIRPGAVIVAGADGILVLDPQDIPEVVERAKKREAEEEAMLPRLRSGETAYSIRQAAKRDAAG